MFDREGYSPAFFKKMWDEHRIACTTYHKFPKDDWLVAEFHELGVEVQFSYACPIVRSARAATRLSATGSEFPGAVLC